MIPQFNSELNPHMNSDLNSHWNSHLNWDSNSSFLIVLIPQTARAVGVLAVSKWGAPTAGGILATSPPGTPSPRISAGGLWQAKLAILPPLPAFAQPRARAQGNPVFAQRNRFPMCSAIFAPGSRFWIVYDPGSLSLTSSLSWPSSAAQLTQLVRLGCSARTACSLLGSLSLIALHDGPSAHTPASQCASSHGLQRLASSTNPGSHAHM